MLTVQRLKEVLFYDPDTGLFIWLITRNGNCKAGSFAGSYNDRGYLCICIDGKHYKAGRLAWLYVNGEWPAYEIDHEDRNRANNKFENLKDVLHLENVRNSSRHMVFSIYEKRAH